MAISIGAFLASATWAVHQPGIEPLQTDWDEIWAAGRALLHGQNPYAAMQLAYQAGEFKYPLIYPGTAVVLALPFALLPLQLALALWSGLSFGALTWSLTRLGWWGLLGLLSMPAVWAFFLVQWSPIMTAAATIPWLGMMWAAKPTIGAAFFMAYPSRAAALGSVVMIAFSFLLMPHWPAEMARGLLNGAPHLLPLVVRPGGLLLLLAFLRWRLPEGRLLGLLALVPQTTLLYDMIPLLLIPRTWRQMVLLAAGSTAAYYVAGALRPIDLERTPFAIITANFWPFWFLGGYLPALMMLLRRGPITRTQSRVTVLIGLLASVIAIIKSDETALWATNPPIFLKELPYHLGPAFRILPPLGITAYGLWHWIAAERDRKTRLTGVARA